MQKAIVLIAAIIIMAGSAIALSVVTGPFLSPDDAAHAAGDPVFYNELGYKLAQAGDHNGAMTAFERALALKPGYENARKNLAVTAFSAGEYGTAVAEWRWLRVAYPTNPEYRFDLAQALVMHARTQATDVETAVAELTEAAEILEDLGSYPHARENARIIRTVLAENT